MLTRAPPFCVVGRSQLGTARTPAAATSEWTAGNVEEDVSTPVLVPHTNLLPVTKELRVFGAVYTSWPVVLCNNYHCCVCCQREDVLLLRLVIRCLHS